MPPAALRSGRRRSSTSRGLVGSTTVPSTQRSPLARVELHRDQAGEVARPRVLRDSTTSMPRSAATGARVDRRHAARQHRAEQRRPAPRWRSVGRCRCASGRRSSGCRWRRSGRFAELRDERAEPLARAQVRPQPRERLGRHRREVDRVPDDAVAQVVAHADGDLDADQLLRLAGRRRDVRRRDDLRAAASGASPSAAPSGTRRAPAPPTCPDSIASASAASSISSPRAVLMMRTPFLQRASRVGVRTLLRLRRSPACAAR